MKKYLDILQKINAGQPITTTFFDWVMLMALSISNSSTLIYNKTWKLREEQYLNVIKKYKKEDLLAFAECMSFLIEDLNEEPSDILGKLYHQLDAQNKRTGQFFTPFHLSMLVAQMQRYSPKLQEMNEPSCGSGGMILAVAKAMKDQGINYMKYMNVVAQDIDWNCVYMAYVQLSLAGIKAKIIQGDTLIPAKREAHQIFYTPAYMML